MWLAESGAMVTILVCVVMCAACSTVGWAVPMGTAFTYQGQLNDSESPANGLYDFWFELYNYSDPNTETQIGPPLKMDKVNVSPYIYRKTGL